MAQSTPTLTDEVPSARSGKLSTLPAKYIHVLTRPSVNTFSEEKNQASWTGVWCQLLVLGLVSALLYILALLITPLQIASVQGVDPATLRLITLIFSAVVVLVATPCSFFAASGVLYLFARLFKGTGFYLEQTYALTLLGVPMVVLSSLLLLIPTVGNWVAFIPHIYSLVLLVLALQAVHHLGRGRALAVILVPAAILLLLVLVGIAVLVIALPR
ncbi:MAG: YIP1 family protein [Chloroflexota bacterium]|nr:YIP1 family protein [Chloroflexota bacterium]